jgi:hypothetical protein
MTIEIVDFPINSMVIFHRFSETFTRPGNSNRKRIGVLSMRPLVIPPQTVGYVGRFAAVCPHDPD